ncbi:MAG: hypothetical protein R6U62_07565 [Bacteroidales bacterium]
MKDVKRRLLAVAAFVVALGIFSGCDKADISTSLDEQPEGKLIIENLLDQNLKDQVEKWQKEKQGLLGSKNAHEFHNVTFDFTNLKVSYIDNHSDTTIVANQISTGKDGDIEYGLSFAVDEGDITGAMIIGTEQAAGEEKIIHHYDMYGNPVVSITFDEQDETFVFNNNQGGTKSWGQDTMDCITDTYTNNGWVSVWAWVQTAFIPATGAAIAGYCAGANMPY